MSKRKVTKRQAERIKQRQESASHANQQSGLIIACYGTFADVEAPGGTLHRCHLRQHLDPVVGDNVIWETTDESAVIVAILPRMSLLTRQISPKKIKTIAANVQQAVVVIAPQPQPAFNLIDSYIVAIEALQLRPLIILNKADLFSDTDNQQKLLQYLAIYRQIGYNVLEVSAHTKSGFDDLQTHLNQQRSVFVGQSGVGKSSLIMCLTHTESSSISTEVGAHGMHTTTTSRLYRLTAGGELIDSPGIREFTLWNMPISQIAEGFIEFRPYLNQCKFRDCQHQQEKSCAIQAAVAQGIIALARLESFYRIVAAFGVPIA